MPLRDVLAVSLCLGFGLVALSAAPAAAGRQKVAYVEAPKPGGVERLCFLYESSAGRSVISALIMPAMDPDYPNEKPYYMTYSYVVAPDESAVTISGLFALKQTTPNNIVVTAKLYDAPQPGWPCTGRNWSALGLETVVHGGAPDDTPAQSTATPDRKVLFYAFAEIDNVDAWNTPIADATGAPTKTKVCLLWRSDWNTDNTVGMGSAGFYKSFSFRVDPVQHRLKIYQLAAPAVELQGGTLVPIGNAGAHVYQADVTAPLYTEPQPGWPCSQEHWESLVAAHQQWEEEQRSRGPGAPGWVPSPARGSGSQGPRGTKRGVCFGPAINKPMACW